MDNRIVYISEINMERSEGTCKAVLCFCFFSCKADYEQVIQHLHPQEQEYFNTLNFEKRINSYLLGRFAAKLAVATFIDEDNLADINIKKGVFIQPIVIASKGNIGVTITHCDDFGAAITFPEEHPLGIDIEEINDKNINVLQNVVTEEEKEQLSVMISPDVGSILVWTAKEALSKIFKTGLMAPFEVFAISKIEFHDNYAMCYYRNFPQYKALSFIIGKHVCSITHPLKTKLQVDLSSLIERFSVMEGIK